MKQVREQVQKQVYVHGPDDVRVDDATTPRPGPRDVVVRVHACGICGTDLRYVRLGGLAGPTGQPMPLGHELSGIVEAVGADVSNVAPGVRVVLNPTAADVIQRCDGEHTVGAIVAELAQKYGHEPPAVEVEVMTFLQTMADRGLVQATT